MRVHRKQPTQGSIDRTLTGMHWCGVALVAALVVVGCGGGDDESSGGAPDDPPSTAVEPSDGEPTPEPDAQPSTEPAGESGSESSGDTAPAVSTGSGTLPADLCADGAPLSGAITLDDLVGYGILSSSDASVDGSGVLDAIAYNDFGSLCNIEDANGDFLTLGMSTGAETLEQAVDQSGATPTQAGEWQYLVGDVLPQLVMLHTDGAGNENTIFANWFPSDDDRRTSDSIAVLTPFAEAIVEQSTVDVPMIDAPGVPPWFVCDDTSPGVAGVDPAVVMAAVEVPEGTELESSQDVRASFGNTECTTRTTARNFPFVRLDVQESGAQLADTLDTYLAGWPEATAETIAGRDVAVRVDSGFGEAFVFTVIDGFPTTIQLGVTSFEGDLGAAVRTVAGEFFGAIG